MLEVGRPFVLPTKREMSHVGKKIWSIITNAIALTVRICTFTTPVMTEAVGTSNGRNIKLSSNEFKINNSFSFEIVDNFIIGYGVIDNAK